VSGVLFWLHLENEMYREIKLQSARDALKRNLELAVKHPKFEEKFLAQAAEAEKLVEKYS